MACALQAVNQTKEIHMPQTNKTPNQNRPRGFASMSPEAQREIARKGGRAAHERGTAHEFNSEEAAVAGRKGGEAVSQDRKHMAEIGAEGGRARAQKREENSRKI